MREYQKKKKQKKLQRYKQLEEEREGEKNKWLAFSGKVIYFIYFVFNSPSLLSN